MKILLSTIFTGLTAIALSQGVYSPDCNTAENVCANNGSTFPLGTGAGVVDINPGSNISNPTTNPQGVNAGCLLAGELNPNWFVINVGTSGNLEFQIGAPGGNGYFDWAMWPYDPASCAGIFNNTLAPVACNWNASSAGFTGMNNGGPPAGGVAGNFQPSIPVVAGQAFVLMFSNYSSQVGNATLSFPTNPGGAGISCSAGTPDQTICLGDSADVTIIPPTSAPNPTFNWITTIGVSNTTGGTNVMVAPTVTTDYYVQISDPLLAGGMVIDTFTITVVNPPMPDAGIDQTVCLGDPILMSALMTDPINNISAWTYDASAVSPAPAVFFIPNTSDPNTTVTVNQAGYYEFIFEENETVCGSVFDTLSVTVDDLQISASAVSPTCEGFTDGEIHIDAPGAFQYSFDGGITWQVDSFAVVFGANTYNVCAQTLLGCEKCTTVDVIDPAPVTISVSNDTLICQNGTAQLSASATGGTSYLFHWDHTAGTGSNQTATPLLATIYTVYAENEVGCVSPPATIDVTVRDPLTGTITSLDTVCPGYGTSISATSVGGIGQPYTFTWSTTDVFTGVGSHTIDVTPSGTTNYTVTVTDGCESTPLVMNTNVRVAPVPVPLVNVLNPFQCEPAVFDIVNVTDPTMSQYSYWLVNGVDQYLNQDTITTSALMAGQYDVQLIITSYEGCIDSTTFVELLNVDPKPRADFKYSPNPILMFNTEVHFTNYSWNGYTYQWYFENGIPSQSTQTNVDVLFPDGVEGRYNVQLITTSELGCVDTMDHELIVFPEVLIYAPNAFTPDDDEHNQTWSVHMEGIDIYDFELLIYNRWGEIIWESNDISVGWDGTYGGQMAPAGAYTWIIRTKGLLDDDKYTYNGHINLLR